MNTREPKLAALNIKTPTRIATALCGPGWLGGVLSAGGETVAGVAGLDDVCVKGGSVVGGFGEFVDQCCGGDVADAASQLAHSANSTGDLSAG
ncbi:hypothetical protein GCM10010528_23690 [Gordonia defluvii]|uniref:Uncharacterized protein n=1 Tax=Gordonia defluvii TaxID=283718 RepID=A0ABP6LKE9_9ACTN